MSFVAFLKVHLGCSLESGGGSFAVWIPSTDLSVPQPSCTVHERKRVGLSCWRLGTPFLFRKALDT